MFCKNCGAEIPAEAQYACPGCNTPLNDVRPVMSIATHLAESILVTLFCCMPFGVVAIVYAVVIFKLTNKKNNLTNLQQKNREKKSSDSILNSLKGTVQIVTVNDYLAQRDAPELKETYEIYQNILYSIKNNKYNALEVILNNTNDKVSSYMKKSVKTLKGYLPYIEFFEEDLPWRYTPVRRTDRRAAR